jgi:DNA-binding transcriptional LysR family regulator
LAVFVREAPLTALQNRLKRDEIALAIVDAPIAGMPRVPLGGSTILAAVASVRQDRLPKGPVRLEVLSSQRLALPSNMFGIRQLVDEAAADRDVKVEPRLEVDSQAVLSGLLQQQGVYVIAPAALVQLEVDDGVLSAHPITDPQIPYCVYLTHSGARPLTEQEQAFAELLRG